MNKQNKQGLFLIFVAVCAVVVYFTARLSGENDESRIRKVIYSGVVGIEKKDVLRCAAIISDNYSDQYSNSKVAFLGIIKNVFDEHLGLKVDIKQLKIKVDGVTAEADIAFMCYFRISGDKKVYYDSGKLKVTFVKEDRSWKICSVEYSGTNDILFIQTVA